MPCTRGWGTPGFLHVVLTQPPSPDSWSLLVPGPLASALGFRAIACARLRVDTCADLICVDTCRPFCRAHRASWLGGPGLGEAQPPITGLGTCADGTSWDSGHPGSPCQAQSPLLENPAGSLRPGLWCRQVQPGWAPGLREPASDASSRRACGGMGGVGGSGLHPAVPAHALDG